MILSRDLLSGLLLNLLFIVIPVQAADAPPAASVTIDQISDAWEKRTTDFKSGEFRWKESTWMKKGNLSLQSRQDHPLVIPEEDTTFEYDNVLIFEGDKLYHERTGEAWDPLAEKFVVGSHLCVWNGTLCKTLNPLSQYKSGFIFAESQGRMQRETTGLRIALRVGHPQWYPLNLKRYVVARQERFGGRDCVVLETSPAALEEQASYVAVWKSSYWVSPEQGFCVLRYLRERANNGSVAEDLTISYEQDESGLWSPAVWSMTSGGDDPRQKSETAVTSMKLNEDVPAEIFEYEFPVGAWVRDLRTNEQWIVKEGRAKRVVVEGELIRGATYAQLAASEMGMSGTVPLPAGRPLWPYWLAIVAVVATAGVMLVRRRIARVPDRSHG